MFELGTGRFLLNQQTGFQTISCIEFSDCCRFLTVTDFMTQAIKIYQVDQRLCNQASKICKLLKTDNQLWDKYPIKLQTEQMLTPVELKLYNQIKLLNMKKLKALQEKPVIDCKPQSVQEIVAPRPDATAELYQAAKNNQTKCDLPP